jgi:hypothetical protein
LVLVIVLARAAYLVRVRVRTRDRDRDRARVRARAAYRSVDRLSRAWRDSAEIAASITVTVFPPKLSSSSLVGREGGVPGY